MAVMKLFLLSAISQALAVHAFASCHESSHVRSSNMMNPRFSSMAGIQVQQKPHRSRYVRGTTTSTTTMHMALDLRGGKILAPITSTLSSSPTNFFNANLVLLGLTTALIRIATSITQNSDDSPKAKETKPAAVKALQIRFLSVFWLLRCADWLQGPYFYEVYSSKVFNGIPASLAVVSKLFLTGFASTALFGPLVGRASDSKGRKRGTLAFALLYSLGAASTKSNLLTVLLLGRVMSGIGTSLLFSAPESWLVGEATKEETGDVDGKYLGETFGLVRAIPYSFVNTFETQFVTIF